jgi:hypothetical protein
MVKRKNNEWQHVKIKMDKKGSGFKTIIKTPKGKLIKKSRGIAI